MLSPRGYPGLDTRGVIFSQHGCGYALPGLHGRGASPRNVRWLRLSRARRAARSSTWVTSRAQLRAARRRGTRPEGRAAAGRLLDRPVTT